jgi:DNA-binding transcriptional ArsR family regulator
MVGSSTASPQPQQGNRGTRNPVVLTDPRAIKALAHPARLAVIDEFFSGRKMTATECAEIAGLSASAMSYHLRALERWGIIRRSASSADGRERPWEAAGDGLRVESHEPRASLAGEAVLINRILDRQRSDALDWIGRKHHEDDGWNDVMTVTSQGAWMTVAEAKRLRDELTALIDSYDRKQPGEGSEEMKKVRITLTVVPTDSAVWGTGGS